MLHLASNFGSWYTGLVGSKNSVFFHNSWWLCFADPGGLVRCPTVSGRRANATVHSLCPLPCCPFFDDIMNTSSTQRKPLHSINGSLQSQPTASWNQKRDADDTASSTATTPLGSSGGFGTTFGSAAPATTGLFGTTATRDPVHCLRIVALNVTRVTFRH